MSRLRIALVGGLAAALLVVSAGSAMAAPPSSDTKNQTVLVRCNDKPCVTLTADRNPDSACPGTPITISGTTISH